MNILGFDTTHSIATVAIFRGAKLLAEESSQDYRQHSANLVPMITRVMKEAKLQFGKLDYITTTVGPGSFTGIRVGLATALGLKLSSQIPLIGVTSFETYLFGALRRLEPPRNVCVLIDARRPELFALRYDESGKPAGEPVSLLPEDVPGYIGTDWCVATGSGLEKARPYLEKMGRKIRIDAFEPQEFVYDMVKYVNHMGKYRDERARKKCEPYYLRSPDVNMQKK